MGHVDDCLAGRLVPRTVVEQVFDHPDRLTFDFTSTGMNSGSGISKGGKVPARVPRFSDLALKALQQQQQPSTAETDSIKAAISAIATVLEADERLKDLRKQESALALSDGDSPLVTEVANKERARLEGKRVKAIFTLSTLSGNRFEPPFDLRAAVLEDQRKTEEADLAFQASMANMQMEDPAV